MDDTWVTGTPEFPAVRPMWQAMRRLFIPKTADIEELAGFIPMIRRTKTRKGDEYWFYLSTKGEAFNDEAKDAITGGAVGITATNTA